MIVHNNCDQCKTYVSWYYPYGPIIKKDLYIIQLHSFCFHFFFSWVRHFPPPSPQPHPTQSWWLLWQLSTQYTVVCYLRATHNCDQKKFQVNPPWKFLFLGSFHYLHIFHLWYLIVLIGTHILLLNFFMKIFLGNLHFCSTNRPCPFDHIRPYRFILPLQSQSHIWIYNLWSLSYWQPTISCDMNSTRTVCGQCYLLCTFRFHFKALVADSMNILFLSDKR